MFFSARLEGAVSEQKQDLPLDYVQLVKRRTDV